MTTPIHDFLTNYCNNKQIRCHMPGGKGRTNPFDITEINGADSLYESNGIIAESERNAAKLFGSLKTLFSCSGSTLAVQTMLSLIKTGSPPDKKRITAFRYSHRSFVSAAALLDFDIDWVYPDEYLSAKLSPESVRKMIFPETAAVFVNSIDYYGGMLDIEAVIKNIGDIPLIVDNAHGAYLAVTDKHPVKLGAAMVADSAHKTLPALTGAAYLHINNERFVRSAKSQMALFGTSSPSYLILDSLDLCNLHISEKIKTKKNEAFEFVSELKQSLCENGFVLKESDLLRVTVDAKTCGRSGGELAAELSLNCVECEYWDENFTVLLFSTITEKEEAEAVKSAFLKINIKAPKPFKSFPVLKPRRVLSMREALFSSGSLSVNIKEAVGLICAEIVSPCPPCVPLIMPGEMVDVQAAEVLESLGVSQIRVFSK